METIKIKQETLLNLLEYINEKEWVTLKDKEGEPYHVQIDKEKNKKTVEEIKKDYIDGKISAKEAEKLLPKDTDFSSLAIAKYNKEHGIKDVFEELIEDDNFAKREQKQSDTKDKQTDLKKKPKEFGGLSEQDFNKIAKKWRELKRKEHLLPQDIKKSQEYIKYFIEDAKYKSQDETLNKPTQDYYIEQVDKLKKQQKQLNEWFDLSKVSEKHMSIEWKQYLKEHPEEFKKEQDKEKKEEKEQ